jgi:hypothetical protein
MEGLAQFGLTALVTLLVVVDPPGVVPRVLTPEGRKSRIGAELDCKKCDESEPRGISHRAPLASN